MFDCSFLSHADFYAWAVVGVALFLVYGFANGIAAARGLIRSHLWFLNLHAVVGGLVALYICWIWWRFNTVAAGMWFVIGNAANAAGRAIFEAVERNSDAEFNESTGGDQIVATGRVHANGQLEPRFWKTNDSSTAPTARPFGRLVRDHKARAPVLQATQADDSPPMEP